MVTAKKAWKFAGGYAYIGANGKRGWSKTKPVTSDRKVNKPTTTKRNTIRVKPLAKRIRRRVRSYRAKRRNGTRDKRIPVLPLVGLAAAVAKPVQLAIEGNYEGAFAETGARFTGYNYQSKVFDWKYALFNGYLPIVLGAVGSKIATKLGVNKAIAKIPMIGKYIKL